MIGTGKAAAADTVACRASLFDLVGFTWRGPACAGRAAHGRARRKSRASGAAGAALTMPGVCSMSSLTGSDGRQH